MVFAGETDDPAHGRGADAAWATRSPRRCSRSCAAGITAAIRRCAAPRARELLTEVQPLLIAALAETADPDRALASFDRFLAELPSGVQLFSLLQAEPALLRLIADIMGTRRAWRASSASAGALLDAVLDPRLLRQRCRRPTSSMRIIAAELGRRATTMQDVLDRARVIGSEQQFLIGVRVLTGTHHGRPGRRRLRAAGRTHDRRACRRRSSARSSVRTAACRAAPPPSSPWASSAGAR